MAKNKHTGVREANGKIEINYHVDGRRTYKQIDLPYSPANVKKAVKIRQAHIDAARSGKDDREELTNPTFWFMAQLLLDTATIAPSTRVKYRHMLNDYWAWAAELPIGEVTQSHIRSAFKDWRFSEKHKKACLSAGSVVFQMALEDPQVNCSFNPTAGITSKIKTPKRTPDPFSADERDQLLGELTGGAYLFYLIRFYAGLRPGEVIALTWKDYQDGLFMVSKTKSKAGLRLTTKTHRDRVVPVHPRISKALQKLPRQLHDDHIVTNRFGEGYATYEIFAKSLNQAMARLGIRRRNPYNARHTCATMMLENGMEPAYCAQALGHSIKEFLETYAVWIDRDKTAAQAKIWASIE